MAFLNLLLVKVEEQEKACHHTWAGEQGVVGLGEDNCPWVPEADCASVLDLLVKLIILQILSIQP